MPRSFAYTAVLAVALLWQGAAAPRAQAQKRGEVEQTLTNASIIKLVRGGFSDKAVVAIINTRPVRFDLTTERLIELKKARVSERVILAMIGREGGQLASTADDSWDIEDDTFFRDAPRREGDRSANSTSPGAATDPGEINIFGSSGGSRGRVRSRDGNGSADNDTETVGSASVRIIRPPSEAGGNGGAPKLEKTPTLTNDAVALLVEAGFSEGTIIRRIEQSPVEFDLSDAKLADLRRRRVTEQVIAAMRAAMADETTGSTARP